MIRTLAAAAAAALVLTGLTVSPAFAGSEPPPTDDALAVYTGSVDADGLAAIVGLGVDRHEVVTTAGDAPGEMGVQVILSPDQAAALAEEGAALEPKRPTVGLRSLAAGDGVFRMYGGSGGLLEELQDVAAQHPKIADFRVIGQSTQGQDIGAVRVTKAAGSRSDGARPTTIYVGA